MAAETEYLKEFLVGVGFKLDAEQINKFGKTMLGVNKLLGATELAVAAAAIAVVAFTAKMAESLEQLWFASQRIGTSVVGIKSFDYAIQNLGGTAQGARQMLEGLASSMKFNPGIEGLIGSLGVRTRDNGVLRDRVQIMRDLGKALNQMPLFMAKSYAQTIGIYTSDADLQALMSGQLGQNMKVVSDLYKSMGVNAQEAAKNSHEFMNQWRTFEAEGDMISVAFEGALIGPLTHVNELIQSIFRHWKEWLSIIPGVHLSDTIGGSKEGESWWDKTKDQFGFGPNNSFNNGWKGWRNIFSNSGTPPSTPDKVSGGGTVSQNSNSIMDYFMARGWSQNQAAGIAANLKWESGNNPNLPGDNGTAWGVAQWRGSRQKDFKDKFGHDIHKSSLLEQLAFVQYELTQGRYKDVGRILGQTLGAGDAGALISHSYEVPHEDWKNQVQRGALAERLAAGAVIHQKNDITIHEAKDASDSAAKLKKALDDANGVMQRNLKGSAR